MVKKKTSRVPEDENTSPGQTQETVVEARKGRKAVAKKAKELKRLEIRYVPIESVKPNEYNPNRESPHEFELLLRSMEEDGFTTPIVALPNGTIVDGEHRWRAAKALGYVEIPVTFVDMDDIQRRVATLRHNRARGSEDVALVAEILRDAESMGALGSVQESLMMTDVEIARLIDDVPAPEALAGEEFGQAWIPDASLPMAPPMGVGV